MAFDTTLALTVSGADPAKPVKIIAAATDGQRIAWQSAASFTPTSGGSVDVARSAPLDASSYQGTHASGLIWSMSAGPDHPQYSGATMTVSFTVSQPDAVTATASQQRWFQAPGVRMTSLTRAADGFIGTYYESARDSGSSAAILVLGGSEGGLPSSLPRALAAKGYPVLAAAYFGLPGLPRTLADIPLEYLAGAVRWLDRQPGVDPRRIVVVGSSRGSEAALLLGAHYPTLVRAVVAASPSSVVNPGFPDTSLAAWTLGGRPLPHASGNQLGQATPANAEAIIPVERIAGPVLTLCGDQDQLWPSCPYAAAIAARLRQHRSTYVGIQEPGAGHLVAFMVPDLPQVSGTVVLADRTEAVGGTTQADALARLDAWPKILKFIRQA